MPVLSQGDHTGDYRILWGYKGYYTHILKDRMGLKDAIKYARQWAKENRCSCKVEGYDLNSGVWITFAEYNKEA